MSIIHGQLNAKPPLIDSNLELQKTLPPSKEKEMFRRARLNDFSYAIKLYRDGLSQEVKTAIDAESGHSLLNIACYYKNEPMIYMLVGCGADVNYIHPKFSHSESSSSVSSSMSNVSVVSGDTIFGVTPVMNYLSKCGNIPVQLNTVIYLLSKSSNLKVVDKDRNNILLRYCKNSPCDLSILKAILNSGVDVLHTNKYGSNALMVLIENDPLPDSELIYFLVEAGINVNFTNIVKMSPLFYAARYSPSLSLFKTLASLDADFQLVGVRDYNVLLTYLGTKSKELISREIVEFLVSKIINVNQIDRYGNNSILLYLMRNESDLSIIEVLSDGGVDMDYINPEGLNALMFYLRYADEIDHNMITTLVECGVNINYKNPYKDNAVVAAYAVSKNNINPSQYLDIIMLLFDLGLNMKYLDRQDVCLIMYGIAFDKNINTLNFFISKGFDLSLLDDRGNNLLILSCISNEVMDNSDTAYVQALIKSGVDIQHVDRKGRNALIKYVTHNLYPHPAIITVLVQGGIDVNYQNPKQGYKTVFMYALQLKRSNIILSLLKHLGALVTDK